MTEGWNVWIKANPSGPAYTVHLERKSTVPTVGIFWVTYNARFGGPISQVVLRRSWFCLTLRGAHWKARRVRRKVARQLVAYERRKAAT